MENKFSDTVFNLEAKFKIFLGELITEQELASLTQEQRGVLETEMSKLFSSALFDATSKALSPEEILELEEFLEMHPTENAIEHYFAVASLKPNIDELLDEALKTAADEVKFLKSQI
jgi:hypothetical protein